MKKLLCLLLVSAGNVLLAQSGNPAIVTAQYGSGRTGANTTETILKTSNVTGSQFGKLFSWTVDGTIFAQPLYVPGVNIGGVTRNVVYVATMHNSLYAFDANNPSGPLWKVSLGAPVPAGSGLGGACPATWATGSELGIVSTPVIDQSTNTLYAVSASPAQGGGYQHYFHAINIVNGQEKAGSPITIQASVPGTGYNAVNGTVSMTPASTEIQRSALLLANGAVYAAFGNCGPDPDPWHGWVVAYNTSNLSQKFVFNSTPIGVLG